MEVVRDRFRYTREQWYLMLTLGSVKLTIFLSTSLQWPLFPSEAEKKGSSATEYGLVFGIYSLAAFVTSPIYGKYMNRIGAKKMLYWGTFVGGVSLIGFGLLDLIDSHVPFITMAFVMRILQSLGTSAAITAAYSINIVIFYDSVATSFAITEAMCGVGLMLGPILGGCLFEVGGYMLPFITVGLLIIVQATMIFFLFPDVDDQRTLDLVSRPSVPMSSVFMMLPVFLALFGTAASSVVSGFISATLEPHLRQFSLTPVIVGTVFMVGTVTYTFLTPLVGYLCDTRIYPKKVVIFGSAATFTGICLIGPAPFLPMDTTLWVICVGFVLNGLGHACLLVATFIDAIHSAVALGLPNDIALYGVISGMSQSAYALGDAVGPSIAGVLFDSVGFPNATIFLLAIHGILLISMTSYVCAEKQNKRILLMEPTLNYGSIPTTS